MVSPKKYRVDIISITLYSGYSRVGGGKGLSVKSRPSALSDGTRRRAFASLPERENVNIKYFISSSGNQTLNMSRLQLHACAPAPRLVSNIKMFYKDGTCPIFLVTLSYSVSTPNNFNTFKFLLRSDI